MLVLTRRSGESLMVGDEVVITVLEVRGDMVRIGIQAPRSVQVHREEVYRELQRVNREAASPSDLAVQALATLLRREEPAEPAAPSQTSEPPAAGPGTEPAPGAAAPVQKPPAGPGTEPAPGAAAPGTPGPTAAPGTPGAGGGAASRRPSPASIPKRPPRRRPQ